MSENKKNPSTIWIKLLRIVAYVSIACGCLMSLFVGFLVILRTAPDNRFLGILLGLVVMAIGAILSVLSAAAIMVFLDMAIDLRAIRGRVDR